MIFFNDTAELVSSNANSSTATIELSSKLRLLDEWEKSLRQHQGYINNRGDLESQLSTDNQDKEITPRFSEQLDSQVQASPKQYPGVQTTVNQSNHNIIVSPVSSSQTQPDARQTNDVLGSYKQAVSEQKTYLYKKIAVEHTEVKGVSYAPYEKKTDSQSLVRVHESPDGLKVYIRDYRSPHDEQMLLRKSIRALASYNNSLVATIKINGTLVFESKNQDRNSNIDEEQLINRLF